MCPIQCGFDFHPLPGNYQIRLILLLLLLLGNIGSHWRGELAACMTPHICRTDHDAKIYVEHIIASKYTDLPLSLLNSIHTGNFLKRLKD